MMNLPFIKHRAIGRRIGEFVQVNPQGADITMSAPVPVFESTLPDNYAASTKDNPFIDYTQTGSAGTSPGNGSVKNNTTLYLGLAGIAIVGFLLLK